MTDRQIDWIARRFANSASRRSMLRGAAPGVLAALLTGVESRDAAARCRLAGERCSRTKRCCAGATCQEHVCVCGPEIENSCGGRCCPECFQFDRDGDTIPDPFCCPTA